MNYQDNAESQDEYFGRVGYRTYHFLVSYMTPTYGYGNRPYNVNASSIDHAFELIKKQIPDDAYDIEITLYETRKY